MWHYHHPALSLGWISGLWRVANPPAILLLLLLHPPHSISFQFLFFSFITLLQFFNQIKTIQISVFQLKKTTNTQKKEKNRKRFDTFEEKTFWDIRRCKSQYFHSWVSKKFQISMTSWNNFINTNFYDKQRLC